MKTRVIVCDDHDLIRRALCTIINDQPDMEVVGEACDGEQAVATAVKLCPDAILMDVAMPKLSGVEATRRIKHLLPHTTILILTVHDDDEYLVPLLQAGAAGYLTKDVITAAIPGALRQATNGVAVLSKSITKKLVDYAPQSHSCSDILASHPDAPIPNDFTARELEVVRLAAKGYSNKSIARQLTLSENTVKKYMSSLFDKLQVCSRTAAVMAAQRLGLIAADD